MSDDLEDDWFERAIHRNAADSEDEDSNGDDSDVDGSNDRSADAFGPSTNAETVADADGVDHVDGAGSDDRVDYHSQNDHDAHHSRHDRDDASDTDSASLFDEDFGAALAEVDVPSVDGVDAPEEFSTLEFGFGGADEVEFDEELDSTLPRIDLGIEGLDRMIQGGVPERSLMVVLGSAGTGKTTFGLQFLAHGLAQGENAVYITLEESRQRVIDSATEKGYPFDEYVEAERLAVVDVDPVEMATSLSTIGGELPALVETFEATRLVLDSVSLLEMMYEERAKRRNEIYDFTTQLKEAGVTTLLTSEASAETPYASRYGIVEYLTDAVFVLQYVRPADFRETRLAIEIQKIRDANHAREKKPYEITSTGISVHQQANLF